MADQEVTADQEPTADREPTAEQEPLAEETAAEQEPTAGREPDAKPGTLKKSAFVAVVGRPSTGKSTLVNSFCGEKVAITSPVPQTTRNAIRGILNREAGQLVFVDTPGQHLSERKMNRKLQDIAGKALGEAELILYLLDATRPPGSEEEAIAERLAPKSARLVAAINKTDLADPAAPKEFLLEKIPGLDPGRIFAISALKKEGLEQVLDCLFALAEPGEASYPDDCYTDQELPFRVAEIIREKAINRLREELPHSLYVEVADAELREEGTLLWVRAFIIVERDSQKGMVVGKNGVMIRAIRDAALKDLKRIFDWKIYLDLRVKTSKDWRHSDRILKRLVDG